MLTDSAGTADEEFSRRPGTDKRENR